MGKALYHLGRFCARRSLVVIVAWVFVAVLVGLTVRVFGAETNNVLALPGTGSQQDQDLLAKRFPPQQNGVSPMVFAVHKGKLTDSKYKSSVTDSVKALRKAPHVYSVTNPVSSSGKTAGLLSKDKQTAFAPVLLDISSGDVDEQIASRVFAAADPARKVGVTVAAGGTLGTALSAEDSEISEVVGIVAAMVILTLVLGGLVAMGLPIITAVVGLGIGLSLVGLAGHVLSVPTTAPTLATMIGLGVGIDYALFLVTRHQDQLREGAAVDESVAQAVATSGSAIVFAGGTVVIALLSLHVANIPLVSTLGLASAMAVLTAVLGAISLLPAFLGLLGHHIEKAAIPSFLRPRPKPSGGMWARWSEWLARHPVWVTAACLALLPLLILPTLSLELGQEDVGATDPATTERVAYDLIQGGLGVGYNGPLQVASKLQPVASPSAEYTKKYNKAKSLKKDLKQKKKQLPKQQKKLEQQEQELKAKQKSLERQQTSLERQAADLQAQQAQLKSEGAQLQTEQRSLEARKASLERKSGQLRARQAQLEQEKTQLQRQQKTLEQEKTQLQRQQKTLEQEKTQLQRQQKTLEQEKTQLQRQQKTLEQEKTQLQRQQRALERERARLRDQAEALARQIRPLAGQLARLLVRERVLERRIAGLEDRPRRRARLEARLQEVRQEQAQVRAELAPLLSQAQQLARQARALARQAAELARKAQVLQNEGAALQQQADDLKRQADGLKQQGAALQRRADGLKQQGAALQRQAAFLRQQPAELRQQAAILRQQGAELQRQANSLKQQGAELQRQANSLKQQGAELQRQADSLQAQGAELQEEGDQLQQEGAQLQQKADQLKKEQKQAKQEKKEAEKLQNELTKMVTAAGGDPRGTDDRVVTLQKALSNTDGVVTLFLPQINKKGDVVLLSAVPSTAPASDATANLVGTVRGDVLPPVEAKGGITSYVGGYTASYVDLASLISARLLLVIGIVILLGCLLLMLAFRSLLIPLQAAVTNLLAAAAAFGVLTATFQWGWGVSLVGLDASGSVPIASYVPLMMFAVLFGLSMDYEVFLVSSVQQHHAAGEPARQAVASGLRTSARITTAAALIMASVFASFILNGDPTIKQFGVGLSVAVLLAGLLVATMAPAVLMLFGAAAWWLPRWLDRLLPHISIEGEPGEPPAPAGGAHIGGRPSGDEGSGGGLALVRDAVRK